MNALVDQTTPPDAAFAAAIAAWHEALGDDRVLTDTARYNRDTSGFAGDIRIALRPHSVTQVQEIMRIAQRCRVPVYPISSGHNWGYGTAVPVRSPAALIDLSGMNRIIDFDREMGVVTLEPGVTQGELHAYLQTHALSYLVPATGAGPSCSIIANALERGFGVTPLTDHFAAMLSLKAVLPDGALYESYARAFNAAGAAQAFKTGVGPSLDALFAQSNYGIVVEASMALAPKPPRCGALLFVLDSDASADALSTTLRDILHECGAGIGAINLMRRDRVEMMLRGQRRLGGFAASDSALPAGAWFGFGSLYGSDDHYRATCRRVRRALKGQARGLRIVTRDNLRRLRSLGAITAAAGWPALRNISERLQAAIDIVEGRPSTVALLLAYALSGQPPHNADLDPARDGCGLHWYAPIVPMRGGAVAQFCAFADATCGKHGLPAPVTLTALSPRHYAATLPLLFDRADGDAERRATACLNDLLEQGWARGFIPYRLGAPFMAAFARHPSGTTAFAHAIKAAIDPNNVLAPGRYAGD